MPDQNLRHPECAYQVGGQRAIVVFEDRCDSSALRFLRPGFRHCFCLVGQGSAWAICDPLKTRIELTPMSGWGESELVAQLARRGRTVLRGEIRPNRVRRPVRLRAVTCVEIVKRILNLDRPAVFTPLQLCRALLDPRYGRAPFMTCDELEDCS